MRRSESSRPSQSDSGLSLRQAGGGSPVVSRAARARQLRKDGGSRNGTEAAWGRRAEGKGPRADSPVRAGDGRSRPSLTPEEAPSSRPARSSAQRPIRARFDGSSITAAVCGGGGTPPPAPCGRPAPSWWCASPRRCRVQPGRALRSWTSRDVVWTWGPTSMGAGCCFRRAGWRAPTDYRHLPGWCQISVPSVFEGLPGWWRFSDLIRVLVPRLT